MPAYIYFITIQPATSGRTGQGGTSIASDLQTEGFPLYALGGALGKRLSFPV